MEKDTRLLTRRQALGHLGLGMGALAWAGWPKNSRAVELEPKHRTAVEKGLNWLAKEQRSQGFWEANGGQYKPAMTGMAGMALLMEGSNTHCGKYANQINRAVEWFMARSQRNGLLVDPSDPTERARYMYGHGFGLLFLASVYGEESDAEQRRKLEDILTRAVKFTCNAQSNQGGWYYTANSNQDEGSVAVTQLQALRAARNAGIVVPKETIDKAEKYLSVCSINKGAGMKEVGYRPGRPAITPGLTTAGLVCMFSAGRYNAPIIKDWMRYCQANVVPLGSGRRRGHDEYTHYYWAQALYILGDDRFKSYFPDIKNPMTWSTYRKQTFDYLAKTQQANGSWVGAGGQWSNIGQVYATSVFLTILQLEKASLPIYQR
ncbi:MAG: hypothetical protein KatS3mg105_2185 [Gemmatales bacterium]|nr:MAG: hypothetical protein KatS3mg105_2185 [Gemmatales bacterium]